MKVASFRMKRVPKLRKQRKLKPEEIEARDKLRRVWQYLNDQSREVNAGVRRRPAHWNGFILFEAMITVHKCEGRLVSGPAK